jgi:hypothetical protein
VKELLDLKGSSGDLGKYFSGLGSVGYLHFYELADVVR